MRVRVLSRNRLGGERGSCHIMGTYSINVQLGDKLCYPSAALQSVLLQTPPPHRAAARPQVVCAEAQVKGMQVLINANGWLAFWASCWRHWTQRPVSRPCSALLSCCATAAASPFSTTAALSASRLLGSTSTRMNLTSVDHFGGSPKCSCQFNLPAGTHFSHCKL